MDIVIEATRREILVELVGREIYLDLPAGIPGIAGADGAPGGGGGDISNRVVSVAGASGNTLTGNGSAKTFRVVHTSALEYPPVTVMDNLVGVTVRADRVTSTEIDLKFSKAPANGKTYKITVI